MKRLLLMFASFLLLFPCMVEAAQISITPSTNNVITGNQFMVDLVVSSLNGSSVGAFDVDILFDPGQMSFIGYDLGSNLGDLNAGDAVDWSTGASGNRIDLAELSLLSPQDLLALNQPDAFTLSTLTFQCVAEGQSILSIDPNDPLLRLGNENGDPISIDLTSAIVNQEPVPVPATLLLLGSGLLGIAGFRKKLKR